jgi:hypothetical protein
VIGERPPLDDPAEVSGLCWAHRLYALHAAPASSAAAAEDPVRYLVIVARPAADLLVRVSEQFLDDPRVRVILDRRHQPDRRKTHQPYPVERRRGERRRVPDYWEDLRYHPVVLVPVGARPGAVTPASQAPFPKTEGPIMEEKDVVTESWRHIEAWMRDGQQILTRVLPSLIQECEELRTRAGSAEAYAARLQREVEDLQGEVSRLRDHVDRLVQERAAMVDLVDRTLNEIARLTHEVSSKLRPA